jgi:hypothetical protein
LGPEGSSDSTSLDLHPLELRGRARRHDVATFASEILVGDRPYLENYTVDASIFVARQATKGAW